MLIDFQILLKNKIKENIELKNLTTLKIGGAARFFVSADAEEDVSEAVAFADENELQIFILGGGSNVLIADEGFDGLVLQINLKGIEIENENADETIVSAKAGEDWDEFVKFCVEKNLAGVECLSGIPGFVGGTPIQNVGAYGQEVSETIGAVKVFDCKSKEILTLNNSDCKFTYRSSLFNTTDKNRFIVLEVDYKLKKNGAPKIIYKDLIQVFEGKKPNLKEVRDAVCKIRADKAMLVRQGSTDAQSAGSFFKNPIVSKSNFEKISAIAKKMNLGDVPNFKADDENVKIPAAWLIEKSGFQKGFQKGRAGLSTRHTLALTNRGDATAAEIVALKDEIQKKVLKVFGVELKTEPVFLGF